MNVKYIFYYEQSDSNEQSLLNSTSSTTTRTDIAILDFSLWHRLHLFPASSVKWGKLLRNIDSCVNFKQQIKKTVDLSRNAGAKFIFPSTTNPICETKDNGRYRLIREFYRNIDKWDRGIFDEHEFKKKIISDNNKNAWIPSYTTRFGEVHKKELCNTTALHRK